MANEYTMRISRLTVDKLGVKLYDKVSAVIAELISNSYDADATRVTVSAPMGHYLATKAGGSISDKGFEIRIEDDGIGMTPAEMQNFFLIVGAERRTDSRRGPTSRYFGRKVMGRKGVGKLAPFGICKKIEVISAGTGSDDARNDGGYETSHVVLNYDHITAEHDPPGEPYKPAVGPRDGSRSEKKGTTVILKDFNYRKVPDADLLSRQIAQRFGIRSENWAVVLLDNTKTPADGRVVGSFGVDTMPSTRIDFGDKVTGPKGELGDLRAGFEHDGKFYSVTGWVAYSKEPYKDDLMAGTRIYCRGKIAAQTSVFNRKAGFTGEHNVRSYLVGELHADWLDEDDDLIQTDRRDVLWSDDLAAAFQEWGQSVVKRIGTLSRDPMRKVARDLFFETGRVEERVRDAYPAEDQKDIREQAIKIAKMLGNTISTAEAKDEKAVGNLVNLGLMFAPHVTLDDKMKAAGEREHTPLSALGSLLRTARIAELSSFGRIAEDRLKVITRLENLKDDGNTDEDSFQNLIEEAPWLINPEWAPVTANQSLNSLRGEFEKYYKRKTGRAIALSDFRNPKKRPDFVLASQEGVAQIVEIKRQGHALKNNEMERIVTYHDCMESFLDENIEFKKFFHGFHVTLVCEKTALSGSPSAAYRGYVETRKLTHLTWTEFLLRTKTVHQDFLTEANRQKALVSDRDAR